MASAVGARVARAVFPVRALASPFLSETQRDALWNMFRVPVYALLLDARGAVVGYECEAQNGLHIRDDYAAGLPFGHVESTLCECGRPGLRLMPPETDTARLAG